MGDTAHATFILETPSVAIEMAARESPGCWFVPSGTASAEQGLLLALLLPRTGSSQAELLHQSRNRLGPWD